MENYWKKKTKQNISSKNSGRTDLVEFLPKTDHSDQISPGGMLEDDEPDKILSDHTKRIKDSY